MIRNLSKLHKPLNIKSSRLNKTTNDVRTFRLKCTFIVYGQIKILSDCVHMNRYINFYEYIIHYIKALKTSWRITHILIEAKGIHIS